MRAAAVLAALLSCSRRLRRRHCDRRAHHARRVVAIDTSNPPGHEEKAAKYVAAKLRAAGIEPTIVPFAPRRANVIARLRGDGSKRPLILLAHLDVVGAAGQQWSTPPFTVTERGGWLYGLGGVTDDKSWAAMATALVIELKRQKVPLHRDFILALTGDEESGGAGIRYVLEHRKELLGTPNPRSTRAAACSSMTRASRAWSASGPPRRRSRTSSSRRREPVAIRRCRMTRMRLSAGARARKAVAAAVSHAALAVGARQLARRRGEQPKRARGRCARRRRQGRDDSARAARDMDAHPLVRAMTRTTCVATIASGGTRNALPVSAQATVNCRIMPVDTIEFVRDTLRKTTAGLCDVEIVPTSAWGLKCRTAGRCARPSRRRRARSTGPMCRWWHASGSAPATRASCDAWESSRTASACSPSPRRSHERARPRRSGAGVVVPHRRRLSARHRQGARTMILVVGAGPTGLSLAIELQRRGVPFRIIDKAAARWTSRARSRCRRARSS